MSDITFKVGHTYKTLNLGGGNGRRDGGNKRGRGTICRWTVFLQVMSGPSDLVKNVTFDASEALVRDPVQVCKSSVHASLSSGRQVVRFTTKAFESSTDGSFPVFVKLTGLGGTVRHFGYNVYFGNKPKSTLYGNVQTFYEPRKVQKIPWTKMANVTFGIELEMSCKEGKKKHMIAREILKHASVKVKIVKDYAASRAPYHGWKMVPDSSISCSRYYPDCNRFELVSPILRGGEGLNEVNNVLGALDGVGTIAVNKTMGFHVHIDVSALNVAQLVKVCQNFIKYEAVMDTFMPPSRRTNSPNSLQYCKSNRDAILGPYAPEGERHKKLSRCRSLHQLCNVMNPGRDRYFKLNLQNLQTGRQQTIEFRQHSATSNYTKVSAWVRFCMALVQNSADMPVPPIFRGQPLHKQFEVLFEDVIKDRRSKQHFRQRQIELHDGDDDCCNSCANHSGPCNAR